MAGNVEVQDSGINIVIQLELTLEDIKWAIVNAKKLKVKENVRRKQRIPSIDDE